MVVVVHLLMPNGSEFLFKLKKQFLMFEQLPILSQTNNFRFLVQIIVSNIIITESDDVHPLCFGITQNTDSKSGTQ